MTTEGKNYRIIQTVASGGTAVLYKAIQVSLDRVVAIKRLHQHLTTDDNFTRRFVLEAKAAASLDHENIVRVIDFGVEDDCYQMVMEYVEGESLREVLERWHPLNAEIALALVHEICRGLELAHSKGIVHRDIKPGNVMITKTGAVKIADFGLAKLTQGSSVNTAVDSILGTPLYMSPEQAFGESVDQRSDLFSLGTVLYELLTGKQPFASENYMGVIQNIINKEIPGVCEVNPAVPVAVENIVARALARDRSERFQSAREFRETIEQVLGLEGMSRALAAIPILLERNTDTRMIAASPTTLTPGAGTTRRSPSSALARRKSNRARWVTMGVLMSAAGAGAGWFFLGPGTLPHLGGGAPAADTVQKSGFGSEWNGDVFGAPGDSTGLAGEIDAGQHAADPDTVVIYRAVPATGGVPLAGTGEDTTTAMASIEPAATAQEPAPAQTVPAVHEERAAEPAPSPPAAGTRPGEARNAEPDRFQEGYLMVVAEPSAQVYVDGVYRGLANPRLRITLDAGTHRIECRSDRYATYSETLRVIAGETSSRNILMQKLKGIISLATNEGAEFYVDGTLIGITPIMRPIEVEAGKHTLTIKKQDYFTWSSEVSVEPNSTLPLRITLSPRY